MEKVKECAGTHFSRRKTTSAKRAVNMRLIEDSTQNKEA
jgi:hypothetical protein